MWAFIAVDVRLTVGKFKLENKFDCCYQNIRFAVCCNPVQYFALRPLGPLSALAIVLALESMILVISMITCLIMPHHDRISWYRYYCNIRKYQRRCGKNTILQNQEHL